MAEDTGTVVQVIGPVLDVEFDVAHLPEIYNALSLATTNEAGAHRSLCAFLVEASASRLECRRRTWSCS